MREVCQCHLFHKDVPFEFVDRVFAVMALCPQHTFQVLTKRPERMAEYLGANRPREVALMDMAHSVGRDFEQKTPGWRMDRPWGNVCAPWPLPNLWLGASCENQEMAEKRVPWLLKCPAAVRFLSCEPLLGVIDLKLGKPGDLRCRQPYIKWVIVGGESGKGARVCNVEWVRSIVAQCKRAVVPVFVKQLGAVVVDAPGAVRLSAVSMARSGSPITGAVCDDGGPKCDFFDRLGLKDPKGGDMAEWPEDLRVREMPGVVGVSPT